MEFYVVVDNESDEVVAIFQHLDAAVKWRKNMEKIFRIDQYRFDANGMGRAVKEDFTNDFPDDLSNGTE